MSCFWLLEPTKSFGVFAMWTSHCYTSWSSHLVGISLVYPFGLQHGDNSILRHLLLSLSFNLFSKASPSVPLQLFCHVPALNHLYFPFCLESLKSSVFFYFYYQSHASYSRSFLLPNQETIMWKGNLYSVNWDMSLTNFSFCLEMTWIKLFVTKTLIE